MTLQPFTNEHLNYFKFVSVVSTEFPKILRQAFKTRLDNTFGHHAESFALAIDQLRLLRNAVSHSPSSEIPKATFDMYIQLTKDAFQALGVSSSCVNTIGSLTEADFPIEKVRKLEDEIRKEGQAENVFLKDRVENKLMGMMSDIAEANQERRDEAERTVTEIKEEIQQLKIQLQLQNEEQKNQFQRQNEEMKKETSELKETIRSNIGQSNQAREKDTASAAQDRKEEIQELRKQLELATPSVPQQEMSWKLNKLSQKIDDITIKTTKQGKSAAIVCLKDYSLRSNNKIMFFCDCC